MNNPNWMDEFPGMISVCDTKGKILYMNNRIADYFSSTGGKQLVGTSLADCHRPVSFQEIKGQIESQKTTNYVAEENGEYELVIHTPWYQNGKMMGLVEISVPVNWPIPIIKRS